jgi:hypothetical protein
METGERAHGCLAGGEVAACAEASDKLGGITGVLTCVMQQQGEGVVPDD